MGRIQYRYESTEKLLGGTELVLDESVAVLGFPEGVKPSVNMDATEPAFPVIVRSFCNSLAGDTEFRSY